MHQGMSSPCSVNPRGKIRNETVQGEDFLRVLLILSRFIFFFSRRSLEMSFCLLEILSLDMTDYPDS